MKTLFQTSMKFAAIMLLLLGGAAIAAHAQGARLQLDQLDILATNKLDDAIDASPIAVGKQLFLRGEKYLYCIEETAK